MTVQLRRVLDALPSYVPGRRVPGALKLASNESTAPLLPQVLERVVAAAKQANRYPDNSSAALTAALAAQLQVDPAQLVVGCGSVSLCTQLVQAVADAGDEVIYAWRSFEAYPIITAVSGATSVQVPLVEDKHDLPAMLTQLSDRTKLIIVCNPNNPSGTIVSRAEVVEFLLQVPPQVTVALDEAYFEYVTDPEAPDGVALLADFPNLVVLRTFSKAYGLAGLRVGYAVTSELRLAAALRQTQVPFAVSSVAQAAALASLEPDTRAELFERVSEVVGERSRIQDQLRAVGYRVSESQGNYIWLPLGESTSSWADACAAGGVIVRAFAGAGVRVTVSTAEENNQFLELALSLRGTD